jgi:putative sterol carrier protein
MAAFADAAEVDRYVGGVLRRAAAHPELGPALAAASIHLSLQLSKPDCELNVFLFDPVRVELGPRSGPPADVVFRMSADRLDGFWRGDYDLRDGLASGDVVASGRISRILVLLPKLAVMSSVYRVMVAPRDVTNEARPSDAVVPHPRGDTRHAHLRRMP